MDINHLFETNEVLESRRRKEELAKLEGENDEKILFEQVTQPVQHNYSCNFILEHDFLGIATVAVSKCFKTGLKPLRQSYSCNLALEP